MFQDIILVMEKEELIQRYMQLNLQVMQQRQRMQILWMDTTLQVEVTLRGERYRQ